MGRHLAAVNARIKCDTLVLRACNAAFLEPCGKPQALKVLLQFCQGGGGTGETSVATKRYTPSVGSFCIDDATSPGRSALMRQQPGRPVGPVPGNNGTSILSGPPTALQSAVATANTCSIAHTCCSMVSSNSGDGTQSQHLTSKMDSPPRWRTVHPWAASRSPGPPHPRH